MIHHADHSDFRPLSGTERVTRVPSVLSRLRTLLTIPPKDIPYCDFAFGVPVAHNLLSLRCDHHVVTVRDTIGLGFRQRFQLPELADPNRISTRVEQGVLHVLAPLCPYKVFGPWDIWGART